MCYSFFTTVWAEDNFNQLMHMDLSELLDMEVISAHKTTEKWFTTTAPIYVITQEDIMLSAAENVTDLLLGVPGLFVSQLSRHRFSLSVRNNVEYFLSSMLVLVDGRAVYNSVTGGMVWYLLNVALENIERIEVIRGSGGISWGANAVVGIINIITKSALSEGQLKLGGGSQNRYTLGVQESWGDIQQALRFSYHRSGDEGFADVSIADKTTKQLFSIAYEKKQNKWQHQVNIGFMDQWHDDQNFRDGQIHTSHSYDAYLLYRNNFLLSARDTITTSAAINSLKVVQRSFNTNVWLENSEFELQYHKRWNADIESFWILTHRHYSMDSNRHYQPEKAQIDLFSIANNEQIALTDKITLEAGVRFERYSKAEDKWLSAPAVRLSYTWNQNLFFWSSVTQSVQFPSYLQNAILIPWRITEQGENVLLKGNLDLSSEKGEDYQLGMRWKMNEKLLLDGTLYYTELDNIILVDLRNIEYAGMLMNVYQNSAKFYIHGTEWSIKYQPWKYYQSRLNFTYLAYQGNATENRYKDNIDLLFTNVPKYKLSWMNSWKINHNMQCSLNLHWVDKMLLEDNIFEKGNNISDHYRLDFRYNYQLSKQLKASLLGRNLLNKDTEAYNRFVLSAAQEISPSYELQIEYRWGE